MKQLVHHLIAIIAMFAISTLALMASPVHIYVSPQGHDQADGSRKSPLQTPAKALIMARQMHKRDTVYVHLADGIYQLEETLRLRAEDSGTDESPLIIVADHPGKAVLSGGRPLDMSGRMESLNWWMGHPVDGHRVPEVRQLWRDGVKVPRASLVPLDSLIEITGLSRERRELWITAQSFDPVLDLIAGSRLGLADDESIMQTVKEEEIRGMEFVACTQKSMSVLRVKNFWLDGSTVKVSFHDPESRLLFEQPELPQFCNVMGGYSLVIPGAWYQDPKDGSVVYDPDEEDRVAGQQASASAHFVYPVLEQLVEVCGRHDSPVHHIIFRGIAFQHTGWAHPSTHGLVTNPGGSYLLTGGHVDRQEAAVRVSDAHHVEFADCQFSHLGATAIDFLPSSSQGCITGCSFVDIGGSAIATPSDPVALGFRIQRNSFDDIANEIWFSDVLRM